MARRLKELMETEGYDVNRFENSAAINKDLLCVICMNVPRDPQMHGQQGCDHLFCNNCILTWLHEHSTCPSCRQPLNETVPAYRIILSMLNDLRISCDYAKHGCTTVCRLEELKVHLKECDKAPIRCPDCARFFSKDQFGNHRTSCEEREVDCEQCQQKVKANAMTSHLDKDCPKARVLCSCGRYARRMDLVKHQATDCPDTEVMCPIRGCGAVVKRRELISHQGDAAMTHVALLSSQVQLLTCAFLHTANDEQRAMLQQWAPNPEGGLNAFIWTLSVPEQKRAELAASVANRDERKIDPIRSPPCYESQGYCFELLLYINGNSRENVNYVALFWGLVPGVHDEKLQWPCPSNQVELKILSYRYTVQISMDSKQRPSSGKKGHHRGIGKMCSSAQFLEMTATAGKLDVYVKIM